mgnify:CR=1 FL=1
MPPCHIRTLARLRNSCPVLARAQDHEAHLHRFVVYNSIPGADRGLASEIRRFGAFYETEANLVRALPAYLSGALPDYDRRQMPGSDRRTLPRGGRRASDVIAHSRRRASA